MAPGYSRLVFEQVHCAVSSRSPTSALHRVLRMKPGGAPGWLCATACEGLDMLVGLEVGLILLGLAIHAALGLWWPLLAVIIPALVLFAVLVQMPFESRDALGGRGGDAASVRGAVNHSPSRVTRVQGAVGSVDCIPQRRRGSRTMVCECGSARAAHGTIWFRRRNVK